MPMYLGDKAVAAAYLGDKAISKAFVGASDAGGGAPVSPPVNSVAPTISGTPSSGQTLTANDGTWTGSPTLTRQWKADGAAISGQTGSTILLDNSLAGKLITVTVTATNAGGSASATSAAVGPVASSVPFTADANTYWWDMDHSGNVQDSVGYSSVSIVRERLRGEVEPWQPMKARQPLKVAGGVNFNQATNRGLVIELPKITNGKNGWYIAGVVQPEVASGQIMSICRNGGSQMSRMDLLFNGSRQFGFRGNSTDNSTVAYVAQIAAMALNGIYAFEVLWDFDADTAKIWLGGVEQTLVTGPTGGPWDNFPASDPSDVRLGNTAANNLSFSGTIRQLIFQDGVPSSGQRSSISSYNLSRAA